MKNKVLDDTNVLLDYLLIREPFYEDSYKIVSDCVDGKLDGCIAAHSISNMFFILRKDFEIKERREILINICKIFTVEGIDFEKILAGLYNEDFSDFEDCLQMECAKTFGADYIITRNVADYQNSEIPPVTPQEFLNK